MEDGGYKQMLRIVAHMEMFLKYIKPVLFLLFFAGPKLFQKGALHVLLHISLKMLLNVLKCSSRPICLITINAVNPYHPSRIYV